MTPTPEPFTTSNPLVHYVRIQSYDPNHGSRHVWCGPGFFPADVVTYELKDVTCHACLDEVVRSGEAAAARVVELERDAGDEATGGACAHQTAFQCTWCEGTFCLESGCTAKLRGEREIKTIARQCRDCYQIEQDIQERRILQGDEMFPFPTHASSGVEGCMISLPSGLAAWSVDHKHYWENKRAARLKFRAALGRLGPSFSTPVETVHTRLHRARNRVRECLVEFAA